MNNDQNNTILAFVLSALVLALWWYFVPQQKHELPPPPQQQTQQQTQQPVPSPSGTLLPGEAPGAIEPARSREAALAAAPRIAIETPTLSGSISLKGGLIDDVSLRQYRETVDPSSPAIVLMSPTGTPNPYFAEFGWTVPQGVNAKTPGADTVWTQVGTGGLSPGQPVTLRWDNGAGLEFRRTIAVDDKYLFTIKDEVANSGASPVTLVPFAGVLRYGTPATSNLSLLHEGMIGVMGEQGEQEITYKAIEEKDNKRERFDATNAWLGFTDKYWATALLPDPAARVQAEFGAGMRGSTKTYHTTYQLDPQTIAPGSTGSAMARLFAGAKEVGVVGINFPFANVGGYNKELGLNKFDLLIDWGRLYFITKPMFLLLDMFYRWFGNFGLAILAVTVLLKLVFFPLANRSFASMAKMKKVQPQLQELRERYPDDKVKQQQEMMEIYKREKINPIAGCLPVLIQIPVFWALYKVLIVTIEMRHAPFYGWIHDLSAPDPTNVFNLFGLLPLDPTHLPLVGAFLVMGAWPLIMGVTMWFQMKLNPAPPDPTQKMMFDWMPVIFTFMLSGFSSGLVIYWAWNNILTVIQQSVIMRRNGARIELFDNLRNTFFKSKGNAGGRA